MTLEASVEGSAARQAQVDAFLEELRHLGLVVLDVRP
jgi:hypothetical protein